MRIAIVILMLLAASANADPLAEFARSIQQINRPIGRLASANSSIVAIRTDLFGEDNVRPPINIRRLHEPIGKISRKRDTLANTVSAIANQN